MSARTLGSALVCAVAVVALTGCECGSETGPTDDGAVPDTAVDAAESSAQDAAEKPDTGMEQDGRVGRDSSVQQDTGVEMDAAVDAPGSPPDSAAPDTGSDGGGDAHLDAAADSAEPDDAGEDEPSVDYQLTLSVGNGGTVGIDPPDAECTEQASPCSHHYASGTTVTLTAVAEEGFGFSHWDADCQDAASSTQLVMNADQNCSAYFVETTGDITISDPPLSVVPHDTEDTEKTLIFLERSNYQLPDPLPFDTHIPGTYTSNPGTGGELPAGMEVNVYFLHFDPVGTANVTHIASATFPEKILALVFLSSTLDATDPMVGRDDVTYPPQGAYAPRGFEFTGEDTLTVHGDRRTVSIDQLTGSVVDQARVITASNGAEIPFLTSSDVTVPSTPPASVVAGESESNFLVVFRESSAITLASDLSVDTSAPGTYDSEASLATSVIASNTVVRSYLVHFNPVGTTLTTKSGTVTFDRDILGVMMLSASLDASDPVLGSTTTTYPQAGVDTVRGYELGNDSFRIAEDGRSIRCTASATANDQLRVVLQEAP